MRSGTSGVLESAIPIGTPTSWSSIVTGTNPGKHGIYEFMLRQKDTYDYSPANSSLREVDEVWDYLSRCGYRVGLFNIPITYPPSQVNGLMVTGLLTPEGKGGFTYPPELEKEIGLIAEDYRIHPKFKFREGKEKEYLEELLRLIALREKVLLRLLDDKWDFFMTVFTESDAAQHAFWQYTDPNHPRWANSKKIFEGSILEVFRRLDSVVGKARRESGYPTTIVVSDHGNEALYSFVHLNNILIKNGLMKFKRRPATLFKRFTYKMGLSPLSIYQFVMSHGLRKVSDDDTSATSSSFGLLKKIFLFYNDIDWKRTQAYAAMGFGQIFLNLKGREPQGMVRRNEVEEVIANLKEVLSKIKDPKNGAKIFSRILEREELFFGPAQERAPDLIVIPAKTYAVFPQYSFGHHSILSQAYGISSEHNQNGIVIIAGKGVTSSKEILRANVVDIAPTILAFFGLKASWMDGKPICNFGCDSLKEISQLETCSDEIPAIGGQTRKIFSAAEEQELIAHLKDLGYA
jgi:predicted AlkP superfamily phosphohydrolase/phosphomutase